MPWQRTFRDEWRRAMLKALLLIGVTVPAHAQNRALFTANDSVPPPSDPSSVLSAKRDASDRMTVPVRVGESGPYQFLVDTGSERTIISRELATRLALVAGDPKMIISITGLARVATVNIPAMHLSNRQFSVDNAPALEAYDIGGDGVLGIDCLSDQQIFLDFRHGTMTMSRSRGEAMSGGPETIIVRARRRHGRLVFTSAWVDGVKTAIVIDTGSEVSLGNPALQQKLRRSRGQPRIVGLQSATGGTFNATMMTVDLLELDTMRLSGFSLAFADANIFHALELDHMPAILLGMDALRVFSSIAIDFPSRRVRFVLPRTGMSRDAQMAWVR